MPPKGTKKKQTPTPPSTPTTPTKTKTPPKSKPTKQQQTRGKGQAPKAGPTPAAKPAAVKPKASPTTKRKTSGDNSQKNAIASEPRDQEIEDDGDDGDGDEGDGNEDDGDDQDVDDEEEHDEPKRDSKRRRRQVPASAPQTVVVHVNKNDDPKFSNDAAGDVLQLGQYLFDIFGEYDNPKERIVKAFEGASKNVFSSSLKTQHTYGAFVREVLKERASTTENFLRQYMHRMGRPVRNSLQYESDVDSLWTTVNKTVKTYEWLAGLCEVGMNPANDIKIEMLFASIPTHIEEQARLVSIRSTDPEVVKNSIKASLIAANNKDARSITRRWPSNNSGHQNDDSAAAMFDHNGDADDMHHNAAAMFQNNMGNGGPRALPNNYGQQQHPRGTQCYACGQDGHQAKQCPNRLPMQNQTYQGRQQAQRSTECYTCGQQGHQSRHCPNKRVQQQPAQQGRQQGGAFDSPTRQQRQPNPQQRTVPAHQYSAMPPTQALRPAQQQTSFGHTSDPMGPPPPRPPTTMAPVTFNAGNQQTPQQQAPAQQQDPRAIGTRPPRHCPRLGCNNEPHHLKDCPNYKGCDHCGDRGHLVQKCPKMNHLNSQGRR
jgi:hypothetical protein